MRRLTPDAELVDELIASVQAARSGRGEPVSPRDLWVAIATEFVFRLPTVRFADAHAGASEPGVGTYCYLFTWESPAFGGVLGSCHALDIPFVFGTVHNPAVQTFSGGGDDAFALSAAMRRAWTGFARSGSPGDWPRWDAEIAADHGARALARPARDWSTGSTGRGTRSSRPWRSSSPPVRASEPGRAPEPATGRTST